MIALLAFVAGSAVMAAPEATASPAGSATPSNATVKLKIASSGKVLTVPANWQSLSPDQLAPYGLVPNIPAPGNPTSAGGVTSSSGGVMPMSSAGCNNLVCIVLVGSGLLVNRWETHTLPINWPTCTFAVFWSNGVIFLTGSTMCSTAGAQYYWYVTNVQFTRNSTVCNSWLGISGYPCKEVHS